MTDFDRPPVPTTLAEAIEDFRYFVLEHLPAGDLDDRLFGLRLLDCGDLLFNMQLAFDHHRHISDCNGGPYVERIEPTLAELLGIRPAVQKIHRRV